MRRIEEKVKDIVEVRSHGSLVNFGVDAAQTVSGYHFTDVTADMMAKWLSRIGNVSSVKGAASAIAGFRGVGKSHFLATLGALLSQPELRSRISDPLVGSTAHGLARRQFPVAFIRRGTHPTLVEELKYAVSPLVGIDPGNLNDSLNELLIQATSSTVDTPLVLLIDTAFERSERVSRDDGSVLAEIAETAKSLGAFVGIALDDDIAGADGANSAITKSFSIDYLDQEHLYKIVDSHIFPKHQRMRSVLHDIYEYYRQVVPGFRWSEQRFTSLYPLHPSIMEIAPFVRLYLHEFALLGFASEAGARIMGRPANSLIAPDEVFDSVEKNIRTVESLKDVFVAFDKLNETVVAKTPVMKRLQAKLILKGLFLFSLNDDGATASEIGASMLIFDEANPAAAIKEVEAMLTAFAEAMPGDISVSIDNTGDPRFGFKLSGKDDLKSALALASKNISEADVDLALKRLMAERFIDCDFGVETDGGSKTSATDCYVLWRGGNRKGRVFWDLSTDEVLNENLSSGYDWKAAFELGSDEKPRVPDPANIPLIVWRPSPLTSEENETIRRLCVLQGDSTIRSDFKDHITSAVQAHTLAAEKVFQRAFLNEGLLAIEGFEYNLTEEARNAQSLSQVTTIMLESLFEGRFPLHPYFSQTIRMKEVSSLVADVFSGARPNLEENQWLASTYALPLGLVAKNGEYFSPVNSDRLKELPLVVRALKVVDSMGESASLENVFKDFGAAPYGLVREAGYLMLAAMVGEQLIEFVTASGDRINRRSLDLKIIWEDIVAVARPVAATYSNNRLVWWAGKITGRSDLKSLDSANDRASIKSGLDEWLTEWERKGIAKRFDDLDDDRLNARIWRLAMVSTRSFDSVAEAIRGVTSKNSPLEACLQRIADIFSDSDSEYAKRHADAINVEEFVAGASTRAEASNYLALCEHTGDGNVDKLHRDLLAMIDDSFSFQHSTSNDDLHTLWQQFQVSYTEFYAGLHSHAANSTELREKLAEILKTEIWWEFENLSAMQGFDQKFWSEARHLIQQLTRPGCNYDVAEMLQLTPYCGCAFILSNAADLENLPEDLWLTINQGIVSYRATLVERKSEIADVGKSGFDADDVELRDAALTIGNTLQPAGKISRLSDGEIRLIRMVLDQTRGHALEPGKSSLSKQPESLTPEWDSVVEEVAASV